MASTNTSNTESPFSKVILWSTPRSLSTSLTKCLSFVPESLIWFEPYMGAMYYGKDARYTAPSPPIFWKKSTEMDQQTRSAAAKFNIPDNIGYDATETNYKWCKESLEADPEPDKKVVFVKGMSFAITTRFDTIPRGFKHSFLIRHPARVLSSWKRNIWFESVDGPYEKFKLTECSDSKVPPGYFFKESFELYEHVKENYDPNPIIIDADDLQRNPAGILKAYCEAMGIPYADDLLQWDPSDDIVNTWKIRTVALKLHKLKSFKFFDLAFGSSEFQKLREEHPPTDLDEDVQHCVDIAMPFYEKMHKERLLC